LFGIIAPDVEINPVCPDINIVLFREVYCSPIIILIKPTLFRGVIVPTDKPLAFFPNNAAKASEKSPVEIPLR
jgi:hypothetical protein